MAKTWALETDTKGTGARVVPLEDALAKPEPKPRRTRPVRKPAQAPAGRKPSPTRRPNAGGEKRSTPLPPGHVRKKATGEIGRVRSVDPVAGTASVLWLKQGRTSVVPIAALSRR